VTTVGTERRRPLHLAWLIALSASLYAASLAAVTAMQASSDRQVADRQAATQRILDQLRTRDTQISQAIDHAAANLEAGTATYSSAGTTLTGLERNLAGLDKSAAALSALPAIPRLGAGSVAAPVVHTTTGASGAKP
jgi:uncharacterized protein YlxW (UPF0749 family)